jgi:tetratricopeptide (TPR) repeat protein
MDGQPLAAAFHHSSTAFQVASSPIAALEPIAAQGLADQFLAMAQSDAISPALQPVAEDIQFNLVGVYMSTGRPAQALPLIETLAANAPEEIRFQRTLAQCYLAVGRLEDAELLLDRLVAGHESHPWVYFLRGVIYMHRKEADRALADFQHAAQLGEDCASLHAFIGNVYLSKRMWVEAEAAHTKALQLDSESPEALSGMAALRLHEQDEEPAIGFLLQAIGVRYEMPFAHYQLGMALARIGQWDRAAVAFRAALALAPGMKNAARYLKFVETHINPLFRPGKH